MAGRLGIAAGAAILLASAPLPANAYLFWVQPDFSGAPVRGDEAGITLPLPRATPAELEANLLWNLRAGLNVAALQCQFSNALMTVRHYNTLLSQHGQEMGQAYKTLDGYFRRTKAGPKAFDSYTTKTYNGFSTMHAQLGFCDTAAKIGRIAIGTPRGQLANVARTHLRELRNSLVPRADRLVTISYLAPVRLPRLDDSCWKKGQLRKQCAKF